GKAIAAKVRSEVAEQAKRLREARGIVPGLAVVRVGEDPGSKLYVGAKRRAAEEVGFRSWEHHFDVSVSQAEVLEIVQRLNRDPEVHGILVQLPLPPKINADEVISAVLPEKDADGFHPVNAGNLFLGRAGIQPCTPAGIMRLLESTGVEIKGKNAVVVGRSNIVGKPTAMLLLAANATVTICHRQSRLEQEVGRADILVVAVGVPELVKGRWIKPGAVVIDVGTNR